MRSSRRVTSSKASELSGEEPSPTVQPPPPLLLLSVELREASFGKASALSPTPSPSVTGYKLVRLVLASINTQSNQKKIQSNLQYSHHRSLTLQMMHQIHLHLVQKSNQPIFLGGEQNLSHQR